MHQGNVREINREKFRCRKCAAAKFVRICRQQRIRSRCSWPAIRSARCGNRSDGAVSAGARSTARGRCCANGVPSRRDRATLPSAPCRSMSAFGTTTTPTTSRRRASTTTSSCPAAWKLAACIGSGAAHRKAAGRGALQSAPTTRPSPRADTRPTPRMCTLIALAFRRTLARADLRERPDAKPGPPRRAVGRDRRTFATNAALRSRGRSVARPDG